MTNYQGVRGQARYAIKTWSNQDFVDVDLAVVELDVKSAENLLDMIAQVRQMQEKNRNLLRVTYSDYTPDWVEISNSDEADDEINALSEIKGTIPMEKIKSIHGVQYALEWGADRDNFVRMPDCVQVSEEMHTRVDMGHLVVDTDSVYWEFVPKHCDHTVETYNMTEKDLQEILEELRADLTREDAETEDEREVLVG